jgi:hypothetical protein
MGAPPGRRPREPRIPARHFVSYKGMVLTLEKLFPEEFAVWVGNDVTVIVCFVVLAFVVLIHVVVSWSLLDRFQKFA